MLNGLWIGLRVGGWVGGDARPLCQVNDGYVWVGGMMQDHSVRWMTDTCGWVGRCKAIVSGGLWIPVGGVMQGHCVR